MNTRTVCLGLGLALALGAGVAVAQPEVEWERTYGGDSSDVCNFVTPLADDGFVLCGHTRSYGAGLADVWVLRTDRMGDTLWSHTYGGSGNEFSYKCITAANGGFAFCCATNSIGRGEFDAWLLRIADNGDSLWSQSYGGDSTDVCMDFVQTEDGGFALAGYTKSFGAGMNDIWLVRTDENGDSLWSRTYGGEFDDQCFSIIESEDEGFVLAGGTKSFGAGRNDIWMIGVSANGDSLWSITYGTANGYERANCLVQTWDGGYVVSGYQMNNRIYDCLIVRFASNGDPIWERTFPNRSNGYYRSLIATPDSGLVVTGWTGEQEDIWLAKFNTDGESLWSLSYGGDSSDVAMSVAQTSDSSFVLAAQSKSFGAGNWDFYLVKTNPDPVSVRNPPLTLNPLTFNLYPAYPNPFNSTVAIPFETSGDAYPTRLAIFDPLGRRVAELTNSAFRNPHSAFGQVVWDASGMPAGTYLLRLEYNNQQLSQRLSLVK